MKFFSYILSFPLPSFFCPFGRGFHSKKANGFNLVFLILFIVSILFLVLKFGGLGSFWEASYFFSEGSWLSGWDGKFTYTTVFKTVRVSDGSDSDIHSILEFDTYLRGLNFTSGHSACVVYVSDATVSNGYRSTESIRYQFPSEYSQFKSLNCTRYGTAFYIGDNWVLQGQSTAKTKTYFSHSVKCVLFDPFPVDLFPHAQYWQLSTELLPYNPPSMEIPFPSNFSLPNTSTSIDSSLNQTFVPPVLIPHSCGFWCHLKSFFIILWDSIRGGF